MLTLGGALQDELLGLAEDIHSEHVFRDPFLDMDVLYRTGETQQVVFLFIFLSLSSMSRLFFNVVLKKYKLVIPWQCWISHLYP